VIVLLRYSFALRRRGKSQAGQLLLNRGADIDIDDQDDYKRTALIYAAIVGHAEFARMLLERGAMIDPRDMFGRTPLHLAVFNGRTEVVRLLLERGADPHVRDENGNTPSELGSQEGYHEIVELLSTMMPRL
jgi:ankyrin repeat protein